MGERRLRYFNEKSVPRCSRQFILGNEATFERSDDGRFQNANGRREGDRIITATHLNVSWQREQNSREAEIVTTMTHWRANQSRDRFPNDDVGESMAYFERLRVRVDDGFFSMPSIFDEETKSGHSSSA